MPTVDLTGTWRAIIANEERRRSFADVDLDDSSAAGWSELAVPSHWRTNPAFADTDGPLLTRRAFHLDPSPAADQRWWLVLDGIFYQSDVWLDGKYVGDTEGYFFPHSFDVTELLEPDAEHLLAIEVTCAAQTDKDAKRNLTGSLQHSPWLHPDWNPGGIWRSVRLERCGPLRIRHLRVRCLDANAQQAQLSIRAVIDSLEPTTARLASTVAPTSTEGPGQPDRVDHQLETTLAAGENRVEWTITVPEPQLWWPHALGEQPLYDLTVAAFPASAPADAEPSHRRQLRTGLRSVRLKNWILSVNGQRLFLKGTNLGPTSQDLAGASGHQIRADLVAARELGLDFVRVHSHIARPELYAEADEQGLLIWQDLPLQWGYARSVRRQAMRQAREAVDLLSHHPSVAIWCGHNEPLTVAPDQPRRQVLGQMLPSWNRSILDRSIRRTLRTVDGTRPVIAHSGTLPHLPQLDGTDSHLWFGWEYGNPEDLGEAAARWPRLVRFVSEFGAQAVPTPAEFCEPARWPHLDWERLATEHGLRRDLLDLIADPSDMANFNEWAEATQRYQAELLRRQAETLRRLKYRPTGGFAQFLLADAHPAISPAILDYQRRPKLGLVALAAACRPVIIVADPLPRPGSKSTTEVAVHVVSDRREPIVGAVATARLSYGGEVVAEHRWTGDVGADTCALIGSVRVDPTANEPGKTVLHLTLSEQDGTPIADNEYCQ